MKSLRFIFLGVLSLGVCDAFSQESDSDYLKNYKAPDFKLRRLTITGSVSGNGQVTDVANGHAFNLDPGLTYYRVANSQKYQGTIISSYNHNSHFYFSDLENTFDINQNLSNNMNNFFYLNEKWFVGFHDQSNVFHGYSESSTDTVPTMNFSRIEVRPAVSIGYGRVEWVQFARQAMDIERSLTQFGHLSPTYNAQHRTALADKIAQIRNRRYYDIRLGRIDQLQALDSVFQSQGLITSADIIYFSQLQDAFLYSYNMTRLSGFRHELGVSEGVTVTTQSGASATLALNSYGFYSFSWYLPQSYAIQHSLKASVIGGLNSDNSSVVANTFPVWADAGYTFGFYPTTRTYVGATAKTGMSLESGNVGYMYGADLDVYYYISPKFRFSASASLLDGEAYSSHGFGHVAVLNPDRILKQLNYSFRFGVLYDIF